MNDNLAIGKKKGKKDMNSRENQSLESMAVLIIMVHNGIMITGFPF